MSPLDGGADAFVAGGVQTGQWVDAREQLGGETVGDALGPEHDTGDRLSIIIGVTALSLGATIGLALYRIRKGWASSLAPAKKGSTK